MGEAACPSASKHIILGTAGHIDHGKTALVKALTGVDTDRLKEEKERGITIELGFASLALPGGVTLGIVDMPGHEKFIDHMVAGASGIDLVLLVVAADEGVMPQTREHLDICTLLGIRAGVVALTKVDLVDAEMEELAREDVRGLLQGTFLEGSPIISFSAVTGRGTQDLVAAIEAAAGRAQEKRSEGFPRLPVDRVFTMKGFGTVLTGTLLSGTLRVGDTVEILPGGHRAKIRGIQTHNRPVEESRAGRRTAVNLQGIDKAMVRRGDILVEPGRFRPSYMLYAYLEGVPHLQKPLADRTRLMFHWGTTKVYCRIVLVGSSSIPPGEGAMVQVRLEKPVFPVFGDRFIVRDFSTNRTVGGGIVLDPHAPKHKKKAEAEILPWLGRLRNGRLEDRLLYFVWKEGFTGASSTELAAVTNLPLSETSSALRALVEKGDLVVIDPEEERCVTEGRSKEVREAILSELSAYHREHPSQIGPLKEELRARLPERISEKLYQHSLATLAARGDIVVEREKIRLASHTVSLDAESLQTEQRVTDLLKAARLQPPSFKELCEQLQCKAQTLRPLLEHMAETGKAVKVSEDLFFHPDEIERLTKDLVRHLKEKGRIETQEFKALSDTTRKYTIPLLEYFDRVRITLRVGEHRVLRSKEPA
jgi:selenocysteine-specific elongation factor